MAGANHANVFAMIQSYLWWPGAPAEWLADAAPGSAGGLLPLFVFRPFAFAGRFSGTIGLSALPGRRRRMLLGVRGLLLILTLPVLPLLRLVALPGGRR